MSHEIGSPIDARDRRLLAALQADARLPIDALADRADLSAASVHRRLKRLRRKGVIRAEQAVLDARHLGPMMTLVVTVEIGTRGAHRCAEFKRRIAGFDEVQQAFHVTGDMDFVLIVMVPDMARYETFVEKAFYADDNVRRFKTSVTLTTLKQSLAVPLNDADG